MIYSLTVDQVPGLPDCFRITRKVGAPYTVRGLEALGKRLKREAAKSKESPFIVRDQNGRALVYKADTGAFLYN